MALTPDDYYPIVVESLPDSWIAVPVREAIYDVQPGFASGKHNREGVGIPHLRPMNVDRTGQIEMSMVKYVSTTGGPRLRANDVLFNNTNSPQLVGKTACIGIADGQAFSNHMTRLRMAPGIDPRFVATQLHYLWMSGYFLHRCLKHVNQASISSTSLAETVPLVLPPLPEQHRIVAEIEKHFTRLDASVAALKRAQANLKRYRASLLKAACEGRLVPTEAERARSEHRDYEPAHLLLERILAERRTHWESQPKHRGKYREPARPDTSDLPELQKGWVWASVEQLSYLVQYGTSTKASSSSVGTPVLRMGNIQDGKLDFSNLKYLPNGNPEVTKTLLNPGDLLFNRTNSAELVGKSAVFKGELPAVCFASYLIRVSFDDSYLSDFACTYINSEHGRNFIRSVVSQQVGQANVNGTKLSSMPTPLPPLAEQHRIVAEVERQMSVIQQAEAAVDASLKRADRLRQSILKQAFLGQLVPQDPNDEPASVLLERIHSEREASQARPKPKRPAPRKTPA